MASATVTFWLAPHTLPGEAADDPVDGADAGVVERSSGKSSHVIELGDAGPAFREDGSAVVVDFAKGDGAPSARSFESKADSSDAAEEIKDGVHRHAEDPPAPPTGSERV